MGLINDRGGWWGLQCPARQPGLSHAHARVCPISDHANRCCECGVGPNDRGAVQPMPADVTDKLETLGLLTPPQDDQEAPEPPEQTLTPQEFEEDIQALLAGESLAPSSARRRRHRLHFLRWLYENRPEDT